MKNTLILTVIFMTSISIFGQENKFTYEHRSSGSYSVLPIFEKQMQDETKTVVGYFKDEKWIANSLDSVVRSSIPKNKWDELVSQDEKGWIIIDYLSSGQVYSIRFHISKSHKDILSDQDFYNLYMAVKSFKMDMSKIRIEYPQNYDPNTQYIWGITCPFPAHKK
jgi:hypothetical protein